MKTAKKITMMFVSLLWMGCSQNPMSAQIAADQMASGGAGSAVGAGGDGQVSLDNQYTNQALAILQNRCASCHQSAPGSGGVYSILDANHLVASGLVVVGSPTNSRLYQVISAGSMPLAGALPANEIQTIKLWITGVNPGAAVPTTTTTTLPGASGGNGSTPQPTFAWIEKNILGPKCVSCHSSSYAKAGYAFDTYKNVMKSVNTSKPTSSKLYRITQSGQMPPRPRPQLNSDELRLLQQWIEAGAQNN